MDSEEKELLHKTVELLEDNNKILRKIRRTMRIGTIAKIIYWTIIIGAAIGAFYFVQPYLDHLLEVYSGLNNGVDNVKSLFQQKQP